MITSLVAVIFFVIPVDVSTYTMPVAAFVPFWLRRSC